MFGWGNRGSYREEKILPKEEGNDSYILELLNLKNKIKTTTPKFAGGQGNGLHGILKQLPPLTGTRSLSKIIHRTE